MADISKFQVYNDTLQLVNATMKSHKHFIREFKYTLGDQIVVKALELMDLIGNGLREYKDRGKKEYYFREAIKRTDEIESRILLAGDNGCMDNEHMGWYIDTIPSIRKQLEGLANSQARQNGSSTDGQRTCD